MDKYFVETVLILYIIPILLISFLGVAILLFINRFTIININASNKKLRDKINDFLPNFFLSGLSEIEKNAEIEKFKNEVNPNSYRFKEILIESLIESKTSLRGVDKKEFLRIYDAFNLHKHSYKLFKSPSIYDKKKGINQFEMMDYKSAAKDVERYIYHKNRKLSVNALIAYIILTEKDLSFLLNIKYQPSFTKEIEILEICKTRKLKRPELLKDFLFSKNDFIVRMGLRLAAYYNASDLESEIANCINHENPEIRELAYKAVSDLFLVDKADDLISRYRKETINNQTQIAVSLGEIGNERHLIFLKSLLLLRDHHELEIAKAIKSINPEALFKMANYNERIDSLEKHVNENLLK